MRAGPASGVEPGRHAVREQIDALRRGEHVGPASYLIAVAVAALAVLRRRSGRPGAGLPQWCGGRAVAACRSRPRRAVPLWRAPVARRS